MRRFESLRESVRAHARSLNSHRANLPFHRQQALQLTANKDSVKGLSGQKLASTLSRYSERREKCVSELRTIIRVNGYSALKHTILADEFVVQGDASPDTSAQHPQ